MQNHVYIGTSPARRAAALAGPLSASISDNRLWTSANLVDASSLASSKRLSSPSDSSSANLALRAASSLSKWSLQTSALSTDSIAGVSSPTISDFTSEFTQTSIPERHAHFLFHKQNCDVGWNGYFPHSDMTEKGGFTHTYRHHDQQKNFAGGG